jgi:hypothetical protein
MFVSQIGRCVTRSPDEHSCHVDDVSRDDRAGVGFDERRRVKIRFGDAVEQAARAPPVVALRDPERCADRTLAFVHPLSKIIPQPLSGVDAPAKLREPARGEFRLGATHRLERRALEGGEVHGLGSRGRRGGRPGGAVRPLAAYGNDAAARRVRVRPLGSGLQQFSH